jgi:activator of HSP90 ATPase
MFRKILIATGIAGGIFFTPSPGFAQSGSSMANPQTKPFDSANAIVILAEMDFNTSPKKLYQALLDSKQFSAFSEVSGLPPHSATIDSTVGGVFSLFGGHIIGRILELVPDHRIVEAWRVVDWPAGVYSIVRFDISVKDRGTLLKFEHIGFPEGLKDHLTFGWQQHYWDPLRKFLQ